MAVTITQASNGKWWVNIDGKWKMYDPFDPTGSDITQEQLLAYRDQYGYTGINGAYTPPAGTAQPTQPQQTTPDPTSPDWQQQQKGAAKQAAKWGMDAPTGANLPTPGGADWWQDQPYGAQWLNRLQLGGQIGAGGAAANPYQSWAVGQGTRARNLNWMQNMTSYAGGQPIQSFGSAQIPWGGGRDLFSGLAGLDPQSPTGSAFAGLSPDQATSMAYTAARGYLPELMRQQMGSSNLYNRYLAGAGSQAGAPGYAPWLSEHYGF